MDKLTGMMVFAKVVEAKSFSAAAQRLGISKSSVSKQVAQLERSLKARLLNRTTRRLSLTEVGTAFYEHCARMLAEAEAAELAVSRLHAEPRGVLKVTVPAAFGHLHIAPAIPDFIARHPEVAVQIVMNDRAVDLAEEGFDIAIRMAREQAPNIVARRLAPVRWAVCAAPGYLKQHDALRTPLDLERHNCLFYSFLESSFEWRFTSKAGDTAVRVTGNFTVNNSEALREAVLKGLGVALLPTFTVGADLREGRLQRVLGEYRPHGTFGSDVYAVYLPTRYLSPKVRAFVDFLVERFSPEPYWDR
ncbi:MAG TPA: LysR family transcriptional regulator [Burkholderiales bacterium]|jgi:DNA-binding transcriptional LysR family regulator